MGGRMEAEASCGHPSGNETPLGGGRRGNALTIAEFFRLAGEAQRRGVNTLSKILILCYLAEQDDGSLTSPLAQIAGITPAGVTSILDSLESSGLIERSQAAEADRRTRRVFITQTGLQAVAEIFP